MTSSKYSCTLLHLSSVLASLSHTTQVTLATTCVVRYLNQADRQMDISPTLWCCCCVLFCVHFLVVVVIWWLCCAIACLEQLFSEMILCVKRPEKKKKAQLKT